MVNIYCLHFKFTLGQHKKMVSWRYVTTHQREITCSDSCDPHETVPSYYEWLDEFLLALYMGNQRRNEHHKIDKLVGYK